MINENEIRLDKINKKPFELEPGQEMLFGELIRRSSSREVITFDYKKTTQIETAKYLLRQK
jgi:hypothetical protein